MHICLSCPTDLSAYTTRKKYCDSCSKERTRECGRKWKAKQPTYHSNWWKENGGKYNARERALKSKYGLTLEQYRSMMIEQNGVCAICFTPPKANRPLDVDHDHESGEVRGLLCHHCNVGLGGFRDNQTSLTRAI